MPFNVASHTLQAVGECFHQQEAYSALNILLHDTEFCIFRVPFVRYAL